MKKPLKRAERIRKARQIALRIDPDIADEIEQLAIAQDRTTSGWIRIAIREALERQRAAKR